LAAFVCGRDVSSESLRGFAGERLVAAMVPEQIIQLDRIPVTANGKTDDEALARLALDDYVQPVDDASSSVELERAICGIWAPILMVPEVTPDTNVFEIGAHSMVATTAHERIQAAVGKQFPVHTLFEYPIPRDLARFLAHESSELVDPRLARQQENP
jgi:surfactin family lipopeptide synthetase B